MNKVKFMLLEEIFKINNCLIKEALEVAEFKKIVFNFIDLKSTKPEISKKKVLTYQFQMEWSFVYDDTKIKIDELKKKLLDNCIKTDKFKKLLKERVYDMSLYFNKLNDENKYFEIEILYDTLRSLEYNIYQNTFYSKINFNVIFDFPELLSNSIIKADTSKSFFFKNYKIKYHRDLSFIIRHKTDNWKEVVVDCIRYAIFHKTKLKDYLQRLTKITLNPSKVDFEITLNSSQNEIKLILVRGIIRFLKKFGIPATFAKYLTAGLTIWGVIQIMRGDGNEDYRKARGIYKKFIG